MIVLIGAMLFPGASHAVELGLAPSHVFVLWTNVNSCLLTIAAPEAEVTLAHNSQQSAGH